VRPLFMADVIAYATEQKQNVFGPNSEVNVTLYIFPSELFAELIPFFFEVRLLFFRSKTFFLNVTLLCVAYLSSFR